MNTPFDTPEAPVPRDRFKRPLVIPPEGGKPVAYTRCTTYVDCLDDKYNLQQWELRQAAIGLADRPDLLLAVSAHRDDKEQLNWIVKQAKEAAKSSAASTTGTAEHALCERVDRGHPLGVVPVAVRADIAAYQAATRAMEHRYIERFTVHDGLRVGGTPDRVSGFGGRFYIVDIKTGSIEWAGLKIAMQLATYAHSELYDPATGRRTPYPFPVDTKRAIVVHLPAGDGIATLHWVDIAAGWEAVQTAGDVRRWRSRKGWFTPIPDFDPTPGGAALPEPSTVENQIAAALTVNELRQVWVAAIAAGTWREEHVVLAKERRAELEKVAS